MINIENSPNMEHEQENQPQPEPDEQGGIAVQGFFRVFDPETGLTIVQGRA